MTDSKKREIRNSICHFHQIETADRKTVGGMALNVWKPHIDSLLCNNQMERQPFLIYHRILREYFHFKTSIRDKTARTHRLYTYVETSKYAISHYTVIHGVIDRSVLFFKLAPNRKRPQKKTSLHPVETAHIDRYLAIWISAILSTRTITL